MLNGQLYFDGFPQFSQMVGGVHTENGVYNARVFCEGVKLFTGNVYGDASPVFDRSKADSDDSSSGSNAAAPAHAAAADAEQGGQQASQTPRRKRSASVSVPAATSDDQGPLPKGWVMLKNATGRTYYQNNLERITQWTRPKHPQTTPGLPDGWQRCTTKRFVC